MHLRYRARKHEHHAKANKYFAEDLLLCIKRLFHFVISFVILAFRDFSLLKTHFRPFTAVCRKSGERLRGALDFLEQTRIRRISQTRMRSNLCDLVTAPCRGLSLSR